MKRIPSLDGLRAISIIAVTVSHVFHGHEWLLILGQSGVDIFFVISGYLITSILLRERRKSGRISLRSFYWRRSIRILPAYFAFLLFLFLATRMGWAELAPLYWAKALTYTVNLAPSPPRWIRHLWSLSVEEHFYLIWPAALIALGRFAPAALIASLAVCPCLRWIIWNTSGHSIIDVDSFTITRLDTISVGCLLAFYSDSDHCRRIVYRLSSHSTAWLSAACLLWAIATFGSNSGKYNLLLRYGLCGFLVAAIILIAVSFPPRWLNSRPMVWVGMLSYSLYIWQPLTHSIEGWPVNRATSGFMFVTIAIGSHYLIERPFLRLK